MRRTKYSWRRRQAASCRPRASTAAFSATTARGRSLRAYARHSGQSAPKAGTRRRLNISRTRGSGQRDRARLFFFLAGARLLTGGLFLVFFFVTAFFFAVFLV